MPPEASWARTVIRLCDRFHCLPSQLLDEDVSLMRLLTLEAMTRPKD